MNENHGSQEKIGTALAFAAYAAWGLLPVYWKRLSGVESLQILCHRIVWALAFTLVALAAAGKLSELAALFRSGKRLLFASLAALLITANWGTYIWAVNSGHVTESSLGYYINPLVSVALGSIFFRDTVDKWTVWAMVIAFAGVAAASVLMGSLPWISLVLAVSFGLYGLVKKKAGFPPLVGLAAETLIASPFALVFLISRQASGAGAFGRADTFATVMLVLAGVITALPLLCFAAAANRITLTRMGFIQYVSPTLQLALGLFVYKETVKPPMAVAFVTVIAAVALYALTRGKRHTAGENPR